MRPESEVSRPDAASAIYQLMVARHAFMLGMNKKVFQQDKKGEKVALALENLNPKPKTKAENSAGQRVGYTPWTHGVHIMRGVNVLHGVPRDLPLNFFMRVPSTTNYVNDLITLLSTSHTLFSPFYP